MNEIVIIALAGFTTGITTVLFGFGGGFVVVPFVYQLMLRQPAIAGNAMHVAVATSTAVMIFNAGWVSYRNWRAGRLTAQTLFSRRAIPAVPDVWYARIYVLLLCLVLLAMLIQ
nr:TSUP family transporter [Klebsiella pneumoniae]